MTRQWKRFGGIGRTALGIVLAAAAVALFAPTAHASPESDATAAINAAFDAAGGDASTLGPRDGGVYAVGQGFAQNFAGGAIFFSPATGAKIMQGAILEKYRALGGPADSDLGFPNIDEGPGRISPESRNSTFSAADNPVIFWTPETGAWVVRGAINAAWDKLGGSAGVLGVPVADETYSGNVISQRFTGGQLSFDTSTKTFTTEPADLAGQLVGLEIPSDAASAIATAWRAAGGPSGPLGVKAGEQYAIGDAGAGQDFAGGKVFYSPETGAHAVSGDILAKYESAGGPTGDFGLPVGAEADGGVPDSRIQVFSAPDSPTIFWTRDHGAVIVRGAMKAAWDKLGGATGALGVPTGDQNTEGGIVTQKFSGGELSWNSQDNTFTSDPANLAQSLGGLEIPDAPVPSAPPAAPEGEKDSGITWQSWWLWWIIPVALLLLGSVYAWVAMRRRRSAQHADYDDEDDDEDEGPDAGYESGYDSGYEPTYEKRFGEARDDENGWSRRTDFGEHDDDAYLPPASRPAWGEETTSLPRLAPEADDDGLFTHRGAHESADTVEDDEDDFDADTAPTRVIDVGDDQAGRHAAHEVGDQTWSSQPDDDDYLPGPGSLFAPVYGAAPPPARSFEAPPSRYVSQYEQDYQQDVNAGYQEPERGYRESDYEEPDYGDQGHRDEDAAVVTDEAEAEHAEVAAPPAIHLPLDDPHTPPEGYPVKGSMRTGRYYVPGSPGYDETVAEIWFASPELAEANGFSRAD